MKTNKSTDLSNHVSSHLVLDNDIPMNSDACSLTNDCEVAQHVLAPNQDDALGMASPHRQMPLEMSSLNSNKRRLNPESPWNEVTSMMHDFQSSHRISKKAMGDLLKFAESARGFPEERLDMDWRTVLSHKAKHELRILKEMVGAENASKSAFGQDVFTCSNCAQTIFSLNEINLAVKCSACEVPWVQCPFPECQARCICTSRLGNRSMNSIVDCLLCSLNAKSAYTVRNYVFDLKTSIQSLFLNPIAANNALAPWRSDGGTFFSGGRPGVPVIPCDDWVQLWRRHVSSLPYRSESWHGNRFLFHPIWEQHGMRSLLLVLFLDWFPPFEDNNPYTIGVMSVGILNFSCVERARIGAIWPLMILSGPSQLKRMYSTMRDVLASINDLSVNGVLVHDELTKSKIKIHLTVAQVVTDRPAGSKIGEYKGHSAYLGCHKCHFKASLCCHIQLPSDTDNGPVVYDNANFDPHTMSESDRVLLSGVPRSKRSGEHLVWLEGDLIPRSRLSTDEEMINAQFEIHETIMNKPTNWSRTRLNDWLSEQKYNGLSPLVHVENFSLVNDIVIDGMHMFFKGINLQLTKLTFLKEKGVKPKRWNIHSNQSNVRKFDSRMTQFQLPQDYPRHADISTKLSKVKAEGMFKFMKIQALLALENLVRGEVWDVWRQLIELTCGILHTHVPKTWVTNPDGLAQSVKNLIAAFQKVYGVCHMVSNWHLMLHLATDFEDWSALRTHWAFASERLNHELLQEIRSGSQAHIDASIASTSTKYTSMKALTHALETLPIHHIHKHSIDESFEHCPDMQVFLDQGYVTSKTGVIRALSGKVVKCSIGDVVWLCDAVSDVVPQSSPKNMYMVLVIACLPGKQDFVFTISRLVGLTKRIGHSNTFNWTQNNSEQLVQPQTVIKSDCELLCEPVAIYHESGFKQVLVPGCGNIPF